MLKSILFSPTPENLNNPDSPEKLIFSGLSEFSSAGRKKWIADLESMSGAIYGFARSADRAAQFADRAAQFVDPHIAQLICRSRNHR